ncbi:MAG: tetratricopeptide repeat protein [Lachnospiraceae bacterium]
MNYTNKLLYQSNIWYNDGLQKAKIRDMSGAIASLRHSLQYNKENIAARNLLGLVYYGRGEVVEALVQWIISKNQKTSENVANYFIQKVQEPANELESVNQAIRKYNQSLAYCKQDGEDLAIIQLKKVIAVHPLFLKAYQLLALLYLHTEQYTKARQILRRAHKLDTTNDITLCYMHALTKMRVKKAARVKEQKEETVTYHLGNETIIQPTASGFKENTGMLTMINLLIGIAVGVAVMWFLIMPAVNQSQAGKENKEVLAYSEQLETQKSQVNALKKELETYRATSQETEAAQASAASAQASYESLLTTYDNYNASNVGDAEIGDALLAVNQNVLGEKGKVIYSQISGEVFPRICSKQYKSGMASYEEKDYAAAITAFEKVIAMDAGYQEGQGLLALADAYAVSGNTEKAKEKYNQVIELYPNTDQATQAQAGIGGKMSKPVQQTDEQTDEQTE